MKKFILLICMAASVLLACLPGFAADGVPTDAEHFPDKAFRAYVSQNCDTNKDGVLSAAEIGAVKRMVLSHLDIASLEGIGHFTSLKALDCPYNRIGSLDVSANTALEELICGWNPIGSLDLSHNKALKILSCFDNELTELDVSMLSGLEILSCDFNRLTELDLSNNRALTSLSCERNQLETLKVSSRKIWEINCNANGLVDLDVTGCPALKNLHCASNRLSGLDLSRNTVLDGLSCAYNDLPFLDLTANKKLQGVSADMNVAEYEIDGNEFDLSRIPGFDVKKTSDWLGAIVTGNTLLLENDRVSYNYHCGNGFTVRFTIQFEYRAPEFKSIKLSYTKKAYTGRPLEPKVTVKTQINGKTVTLIKGQDYLVTYRDNVDAGTATAVIEGIDRFGGVYEKPFTITPVKLTKLTLSKKSLAYTGAPLEPPVKVTAKVGGKTVTLEKDRDYLVTCENNTDAGTASVTVTGTGNFRGSLKKTFTVTAKKILRVTVDGPACVYNGKPQEPPLTVKAKAGGEIVELVKGRDYTAEYTSNVSAGKALVTVKGIGNFKGTLKKAFTILPAEVLKASVTGNLTYTGQPLEPKVTVRAKLLKKTVVLQPGRDYTVTCSGNVDAGTARVTVTGTGDYTGTLQKSFTIAPAKILRVILSADRMAYTGEPIRPEVTVRTKLGGVLTVLEEGKDYTLTFTDDIGPGTASVTVTGIGNFTGVFVREFTIE